MNSGDARAHCEDEAYFCWLRMAMKMKSSFRPTTSGVIPLPSSLLQYIFCPSEPLCQPQVLRFSWVAKLRKMIDSLCSFLWNRGKDMWLVFKSNQAFFPHHKIKEWILIKHHYCIYLNLFSFRSTSRVLARSSTVHVIIEHSWWKYLLCVSHSIFRAFC